MAECKGIGWSPVYHCNGCREHAGCAATRAQREELISWYEKRCAWYTAQLTVARAEGEKFRDIIEALRRQCAIAADGTPERVVLVGVVAVLDQALAVAAPAGKEG